jgi:PGF-pre-PGF domain-containing protein
MNIQAAGAKSISGASLEFSVPKSWLAEKGIGKNDVAMLYYTGKTWGTLPTVIIKEDANNVYYSSRGGLIL